MGRPKNRLERRAQIVQGLLQVMAQQGYARATIAAIGKAAGLTPGLLHYHFESKEMILVALVEELVERLERRYAALAARAGDDAHRRLAAFVDAHLALGEGADPEAVAAWVVVGAEAVRQREVRRLYARAVRRGVDRLTELIAAALRAERRSPRNARPLAAAVYSAIQGAYQLSAAAPGVLPPGFAAPTVRAMLARLI